MEQVFTDHHCVITKNTEIRSGVCVICHNRDKIVDKIQWK